MPARFLLGPAGSGKTFRCLAEIRAELKANPDGAPLIFLAPKQATFQIERQLLETEAGADPLAGFSRLHIFSFDKLADFIFAQLNLAPPRLLAGEGRIMVLRALLMRHEAELKLFGRSARRPGFAQELSALLSELQQHQFSPAKLRALAGNQELRPELQNKLLDLARLLEAYTDWLQAHQLQDADCLLALATEALKDQTVNARLAALRFGGLWLDGFAEMTPQELDLLAAIVPFCRQATLAFCLEDESKAGEPGEGGVSSGSRLSIWSAIGRTFQRCRARLNHLPASRVEVELLARDLGKNRFAESAVLQFVEKNWQAATPGPVPKSFAGPANGLSLCACANPEAEAVQAARTILKFVRDKDHPGRRFRDCAVLVRHLDQYHKSIARVFRRYGIPFFLDRRESVAHHPLAELTRGACRTIAFDWQHDDWFAALKAGFSPVPEADIDRLENAALEFGWRGKKWREPLEEKFKDKSEFFAEVLARIIPPFESLFTELARTNFQPTGAQLAEAIRELWNQVKVQETLEIWTEAEAETQKIERITHPASPHQTVFEQMNRWLDNLTLAFPDESLSLRDWLPVLEAGLAGLTVGVVPPVLDEVLVGAIDRARNPELKLMLLLGVNESVFPASPASPAILTQSDRDELESQNAALGPDLFDQISRERFLGYIACTRSREQLRLSYSRQGAEGSTLNPSPFIAHLQKLVPGLVAEEFSGEADWHEAEHPVELVQPLIAAQEFAVQASAVPTVLTALPVLKPWADKLAALREPDENESLSPVLAEKIYGPILKSSVSRLEEFAACAFRFFVRSGLRANERKVFELDARERGNFQHDVLKLFQEQLEAENKRWRDLTVPEARDRIGAAAATRMQDFRDGLLHDSPQTRFAAQTMAAALQDFVETIVIWMHRQYEFDPAAAELDFGSAQARIPAWELDLGAGHKLALQGRIDRVDLWRSAQNDQALAVVMDYKSSGKRLEPLLMENGVQLQLLAYLGALRRWKSPRELFGVDRLVPAGAFYINLRGDFKSGSSRDDVLGDAGANRVAYRHSGRFDTGALGRLDSQKNADQFTYRLAKDGSVYANSAEALPREEFEALLDRVEEQLRTLGARIFAGEATVDPYRKGSQTPCEYCDYRPICRIDEWTHTWRILRAPASESSKGVASTGSR
jgi:ATP-dependent helicase/nuclease subunit B